MTTDRDSVERPKKPGFYWLQWGPETPRKWETVVELDQEGQWWNRDCIILEFDGDESFHGPIPTPDHAEAQLQAAVAEVREALRPFADAIKYVIPELPDSYAPGWADFFTYGDFRSAAAAFTPAPTGALERAIEAEREACAALCEGVKDKAKEYGIFQMAIGANECCDLIRARSDAQNKGE